MFNFIRCKKGKVIAISDRYFTNSKINKNKNIKLGSKIINPKVSKIAVVCNWGCQCGISTYTKFLVDSLNKITTVKIFSEYNDNKQEEVNYCWSRGQSLDKLKRELEQYEPDFILVQHEFGLFPKATHWLSFLSFLEDYNYAVVLHSTYEHRDKSICTAGIKNIIVHTEEAKNVLIKLGNRNNIHVIPHGCVNFNEEERKELWNILQTPYCIIQFGFGFFYKGVDRSIDAIYKLKSTDPKFKDIFFTYLCSENEHTRNVHDGYFNFLQDKIKDLGLEDNIAIIRGYHSEEVINNYLRTYKIAIFPYAMQENNIVYGASGAARIAMANSIPTIVSDSHLFDDLEDVLPRIKNSDDLAIIIDEIFSNESYRNHIIKLELEFCLENSWDNVAKQFVDLFNKIIYH